MIRFILWGTILAVGLVGLTVEAEDVPVEEEEVLKTCDLKKPHSSVEFCQSDQVKTKEVEECCSAICSSCHPTPQEYPDLSGPTEWKSSDAVLADVYVILAHTEEQGLADLCINCHETRFIEKVNHPVEIAYEPSKVAGKLIANPDGPKLVCVSNDGEGVEGCLLRCVTCHTVHPAESEGNQLQGLLRVSSVGSDLCLRCHVK